MDQPRQDKIRTIYANFKKKLQDIVARKKVVLSDYRQKTEKAKIKEIKDSLHI